MDDDLLRGEGQAQKKGNEDIESSDSPLPLSIEVDNSEVMEHLHEALQYLSLKQRRVLFFHYWLDLPARRIAERLGLSVRAVERLRQRAIGRLRELLIKAG